MTQGVKHTPGPWEARGDEVYADPSAYDVLGDAFICETAGNIDNARLIAAAPELLAALQKAAWFIENVSDDTPDRTELFFETREAWRNAIAKASAA
jgi:hypothetical protein